MTTQQPPYVSGGIPGLGHVMAFRKDRTALLRRGYQEHGHVFALRLATQNVAVVIGPEMHKVFFMETDKKLDMAKPYQFIRAIFGDLAFLGSTEKYKAQRKIIHNPFRREKMQHYNGIMQAQVQRWLDSLPDEGEMELVSQISGVVQNVAGYALMGEAFQEEVGSEFWALYDDISAALDPILPPHWPLPKFRRRDKAKARMIEILRPIITERRAHPEAYDDFLQDFINARDANGRLLSDDEVISLILGFNFAGHETTAGQASWTVIQLLQNPWYQQLVNEEIATQLPAGAEINEATLKSIHHIHWAVQETGRMHPSADMLMRYATEDVTFGDYVVPAGWLVQTATMVAHFLPEVFAEPEKYDPLRFAPGREEDKADRFALIGFGGGMHKCAGMNFANIEMAVITALLFQQFELELLTPEPETVYGMGAAHPGKTRVHFKRKVKPQVMAESVEAGSKTT